MEKPPPPPPKPASYWFALAQRHLLKLPNLQTRSAPVGGVRPLEPLTQLIFNGMLAQQLLATAARLDPKYAPYANDMSGRISAGIGELRRDPSVPVTVWQEAMRRQAEAARMYRIPLPPKQQIVAAVRGLGDALSLSSDLMVGAAIGAAAIWFAFGKKALAS